MSRDKTYTLDDLRQVKGIGKKTIERIKEQFDDSEYVSKYDSAIHIEPNELINGDMLDVMNGIPEKSVDLILTDPPYGMDYQSGRRKESYEKIINDVSVVGDIDKWTKQFHRVLKEDSGLYVFCSWHHVDVFKKTIESHFNIKNIIVWNKNNHGSGDLTGSFAPKHEFVIYAHKGRVLNRGKRKPDVIDCARIDGTKSVHPTQKPEELLVTLLKNSTDEDDTVLDPFMGSGSTGVACANTNRKFIGIELDDEYYKIAKERIEKARLESDVYVSTR